MPYWIEDDGETQGPMRAIDVLRLAQPTTRICDGETWFQLDDGLNIREATFTEPEHGRTKPARARVVIR